jgi:hypothetical protein
MKLSVDCSENLVCEASRNGVTSAFDEPVVVLEVVDHLALGSVF